MPVVADMFCLWWILCICASLPVSGLQFTSKFTVMLHRPAATPNFIAVSYCHQNHQIIKVMEHLVLKLFGFFLLLCNFVFFFSLKNPTNKPNNNQQKSNTIFSRQVFFFFTEICLEWKKATIVNICFVKHPNQLMSVSITLLSLVELWWFIPSRALGHHFYLSFLLMPAPLSSERQQKGYVEELIKM